MRNCGKCGGRLHRVHRTFGERFRYLAIYTCKGCQNEEYAPRPFFYHVGECCRCPRCGTFRVVRLKERDHIDYMHKGLLNVLERLAGGRLHHCRYCRLQFYDRRKRLASELLSDSPVEKQEVAAGRDVKSGD